MRIFYNLGAFVHSSPGFYRWQIHWASHLTMALPDMPHVSCGLSCWIPARGDSCQSPACGPALGSAVSPGGDRGRSRAEPGVCAVRYAAG